MFVILACCYSNPWPCSLAAFYNQACLQRKLKFWQKWVLSLTGRIPSLTCCAFLSHQFSFSLSPSPFLFLSHSQHLSFLISFPISLSLSLSFSRSQSFSFFVSFFRFIFLSFPSLSLKHFLSFYLSFFLSNSHSHLVFVSTSPSFMQRNYFEVQDLFLAWHGGDSNLFSAQKRFLPRDTSLMFKGYPYKQALMSFLERTHEIFNSLSFLSLYLPLSLPLSLWHRCAHTHTHTLSSLHGLLHSLLNTLTNLFQTKC